MKEINLNLETKKIDCEVIKIKSKFTVEYGIPENVILKHIMRRAKGALLKELKELKK